MTAVLSASSHIRETIESSRHKDWILAFSGGKDSTALLCLIFNSLLKLDRRCLPSVEVLYCDTKTENPIIDRYVKSFFGRFQSEIRTLGLDVNVKIVRPPSNKTYFARVIGRGYPPPTNAFRWCTKDLRIMPVEEHLATRAEAIVALGVRESESRQRDRMLGSHNDPFWMIAETAKSKRTYYTPIRRLTTEDVWDVIFFSRHPTSLDRKQLWDLYSTAGGDCPIIRAPDSAPCASGRFGCWTCTVVRKDRSGENLFKNGHAQMKDFLDFRQMLLTVRNNMAMRWPVRRNGVEKPGPLTVAARRLLLKELRAIERTNSISLLSEPELTYIKAQWRADRMVERAAGFG